MGAPEAFEALAGAAGARGQFARAARLFGAAESLRDANSADVLPGWHTHEERPLVAAREALGAAAFAEALAEGRAMSPERTVEYALAADEPGAPGPEGPSAPDPTIPLSHREREVAVLIARGLTNRQIAAALVIAERTAETHVEHILR